MRIGDSNHLSKTVNTQFLEIKGVFIHPNYNGISSYFDIAIVETANVTLSYFVSPICLPRSEFTFTLLNFLLNSISFYLIMLLLVKILISYNIMLLLGSLWLSNQWSFKVNQMIRMIL